MTFYGGDTGDRVKEQAGLSMQALEEEQRDQHDCAVTEEAWVTSRERLKNMKKVLLQRQAMEECVLGCLGETG